MNEAEFRAPSSDSVDLQNSSLLQLSAHLLDETNAPTGRPLYSEAQPEWSRLLEMILQQAPLSELFDHISLWFQRRRPAHTCAFVYHSAGHYYSAGGLDLLASHPNLASDIHQSLEDGETGLWPLLEKLRFSEGWQICAAGAIPSSIAEPWGAVVLLQGENCQKEEYEASLTELCRVAAVVLDHRHLYELLVRQANFDMLTGLPNRFLFDERLESILADARRRPAKASVLWIDMDRFQEFNDLLGHRTGDEVIRQVAQRLTHRLPASAILARLGGDEFAIALPQWGDYPRVEAFAEKVLTALRLPFRLGEQELFLTASIGFSIFPDDGEDGASLQRNADSALHQVKRSGRNHARPYTTSLNLHLHERLELEANLQRAVERNEFTLLYQPQVTPKGNLRGFEALVRWQHPKRGTLSPAQFIPLAEELGVIVPIGRWVLREACRQMAQWKLAGYEPCRVAVNVSALQLYWAEFSDTVRQTLEEYRLAPDQLELELTESSVLHNVEEAVEQMRRLESIGVHLSIDDFGVGYSSLSYLQRLPVKSLKIDKSFTDEICSSPAAAALVQSIIVLGHNLGMTVVAEGVEELNQWSKLADFGCDLIQGYLIGRPMPPEKAKALLSPLHGPARLLLP